MMPPLFLHIADCTPADVDSLTGLLGRRVALTTSKSPTVLQPSLTSPTNSKEYQPYIKDVTVDPNNPAIGNGTGALVILELAADLPETDETGGAS